MKSNKQRQAEYRARRREKGLCAFPGCPEKSPNYALCDEHRLQSSLARRNLQSDAENYTELWTEHNRRIAEIKAKYEGTIQELRFALDEANRRKAGYLPEGRADSIKLKPGVPYCLGHVA